MPWHASPGSKQDTRSGEAAFGCRRFKADVADDDRLTEVETVVEVLSGKNKNEQALLDTTIALCVELYSMVFPAKSKIEIKKV